jgi:SAM-dependent methyltransferase
MKSHDLTLEPKTDPTDIYRYRDGLYAVDLLTAALTGLDFFTWLAENPSDRETICRSLGIKERPTDVMLTLFTAMGLLENKDAVFHLTERAREHLTSGSPWNLAPYYASLKERPVCQDMLAVLRTGKPANWASLKTEKEWAKAMEGEAFANQFTAAMDCRGVYLGQALAKRLDLKNRRHLLDIAGGSGIYACSLVAHHAQLKATVLEKPPVDRVAKESIAKRGFAARVTVLVGDMFKDALPEDGDVHLISNVLHDWDEPLVKKILARSFEALLPGGTLVIHDAHINADKTGPLPVAAYSALLMNITEGKCYSVREMESYLEEIGFRRMKFIPTVADRSIITAIKAA